MKHVMHHDVMRYAQFTVRVWVNKIDFQRPDNTTLQGIARFKQFRVYLGTPVRFSELDIGKKIYFPL